MKKAYNTALAKKFREGMARIPRFSEIEVRTRYFSRNERVFEMKRDGISCFIILIPSQLGRNEFTIELGWSSLCRPPELAGRPSVYHRLNHEEFKAEEFVIRIGDLIPGSTDCWVIKRPGIEKTDNPFGLPVSILEDSLPITSEEAEAVMEPLVKDCVDKIVEYGLPYLEKLLAYRKENLR
jgi:hypothetical protein